MPLCEMCNQEVSQEEYDFCEICPDCRDEEVWLQYLQALLRMIDENDYISINTDSDGNVTLIED